MSKYTIRIRDTDAMRRIDPVGGSSCTYASLKSQIAKLTGIDEADQLLSLKPPHDPEFIQAQDNTKLSDLNIKHGDVIYLINIGTTQPKAGAGVVGPTGAKSSANSIGSLKLTAQCQHGPRGRCLHCDAIPPGETPTVKGKCSHATNTTCIHCSQYIKDKIQEEKKPASERASEQPADWLCTHPPTVFCPKCLPPEEVDENAKTKIDVKPFKQLLAENQALCHFRHDSTTTCAMCIPPRQPSFTGIAVCNRGHQPWPRGVCTHCAPPTAVIRPQTYRHLDGISIPSEMLQNFYRRWTLENRRSVMRCALLLGRVIDETSDIENPHAVRAVVSALYEPPQRRLADGVRLLKDDKEELVLALAAQGGLIPVGWVITSLERPTDKKYGGKVFLSGLEVCIAATLQQKYLDVGVKIGANNSYPGFSQFATVILEQADMMEPKAYMMSDQCQALVRDGCLLPGEDPYLVRSRPAEKGELTPKIVYHDKPLPNGADFLPDNFLVKIRVMTSASSSYSFAMYEFPSRVDATEALLKSYLRAHSNDTYGVKLSDFNVLVFLVLQNIITFEVASEIIKQITAAPGGVAVLTPDLCSTIDTIFLQHGLLEL